tara:strand:+ start:17 stop:310 length:294 start_codon:yes stop_codon:yes gene_type:complete
MPKMAKNGQKLPKMAKIENSELFCDRKNAKNDKKKIKKRKKLITKMVHLISTIYLIAVFGHFFYKKNLKNFKKKTIYSIFYPKKKIIKKYFLKLFLF